MTQAIEDIHAYLARHQQKELLRFLTCGSVDDGKSTLIGRLLHDTKGIYEDQLAAVRRDSARHGTTGAGEVDLALLTDGLKAEREQGITIDVAYRYFSTDKRKFIIADTPGHEQYTRNMATGASTCQLAIILVDARHGVVVQTRRHSFIVSLLGIRNVVVAVNKMDLVGYARDTFEAIRADYAAFAQKLGLERIAYIPLSALKGDNVVERSGAMDWYDGPALLEHLETVPLGDEINRRDLRFPVQHVLRPNPDFRGFAGTIASGIIRRGDEITILPSGKKSRVKSIVTWEREREEAFAPMAVTVTLTDEIDISRGDMLAHGPSSQRPGETLPHQAREVEAMIVWMHEKPLVVGKSYIIKQTTRLLSGDLRDILYGVDVNTLEQHATTRLALNEVGRCVLQTNLPLVFDPYRENRATGAFIMIDRLTNTTVGAGMILQTHQRTHHGGPVTQKEKENRLGQRGLVLWIRSQGSGTAAALERQLFEEGRTVVQLDAAHLDLEEAEAAQVAQLLSAQGLIVIVAAHQDPSSATCDLLGDRLVASAEEDPAALLGALRTRGLITGDEILNGEGI